MIGGNDRFMDSSFDQRTNERGVAGADVEEPIDFLAIVLTVA